MSAILHGCGLWFTEIKTIDNVTIKMNMITVTEKWSKWLKLSTIKHVQVIVIYMLPSIMEYWKHNFFTEPCRTQRFITLPEYWLPTDNIQGWEELLQPVEGEIHVMVGLSTTLAKYTIREYKVEFNGLVSAVGGSLGLFLGFSVLTTLQSAYSCVGRKMNVYYWLWLLSMTAENTTELQIPLKSTSTFLK